MATYSREFCTTCKGYHVFEDSKCMNHKNESSTITPSLVNIHRLKDGSLSLEISLTSESLRDKAGNATTFLKVSDKELERIYQEIGYYLFEKSLK